MFEKIFLKKNDDLRVQFIRYGIVAIIAFLIDFGLLFFFTQYWHIHYLISATLSFLVSLIFNYILSIKWAFSRQSSYNYTTEFVLFLIIALVGLIFNDLIIWLLTEKFEVFYLLSKLVSTVAVFFWSFVARRYLFYQTISTYSKVLIKE